MKEFHDAIKEFEDKMSKMGFEDSFRKSKFMTICESINREKLTKQEWELFHFFLKTEKPDMDFVNSDDELDKFIKKMIQIKAKAHSTRCLIGNDKELLSDTLDLVYIKY